jgi:hypothetical protein
MNPEILVWAGFALVACIVVGVIAYQSGLADGIEKAGRILDDTKAGPVTRRQCRMCWLDVRDCCCPMASRRGSA